MRVIQLAAAEYGEGAPVAILHGLFGSGRNWRSIAQQLAAQHRVLAFDLRNHGASPWANGMSYREMIEDLRISLLERGVERTGDADRAAPVEGAQGCADAALRAHRPRQG